MLNVEYNYAQSHHCAMITADFMNAGGNLKTAKRFNNAIRQPLFLSIPLSQVRQFKSTYLHGDTLS